MCVVTYTQTTTITSYEMSSQVESMQAFII